VAAKSSTSRNKQSRIHVIVRGRVQGVWFRESTRRRALELGVAGWVRNRSDGSVEAVFAGDAEAVDLARRFVEVGPEHARVDSVEVSPIEASGGDAPPAGERFRVL